MADFDSVYHSYDQIGQRLDVLVAQYPSLVTKGSIGKSVEGRDIVSVTLGAGDRSAQRSDILLVGGVLGARKWLGPAALMAMLTSLLDQGTDLLQGRRVLVVPQANPDGYEYSRTNNRLWLKNLNTGNGGGSAFGGVSLDKNFGFQWGNDDGSSSDPSSDNYRGPQAFSEPETRALRDLIKTSGSALGAVVNVGGSGHLVLRPWGYTRDHPATDSVLSAVGGELAAAMETSSGQRFSSYPIVDQWPVSGALTDFVYGQAGVPLAFELHLTGDDNSEVVPPTEIQRSGTALYQALRALTGHCPS